MKSYAATALFLFVILFSRETPAQITAQKSDGEISRSYLRAKVDHYAFMKFKGKAMTITGIAFKSAAALLFAAPSLIARGNVSASIVVWPMLFIPATILAVNGTALLAIGIPHWVIGAKREKQYETMQGAIILPSAGFDPVGKTGHVGVTVRF